MAADVEDKERLVKVMLLMGSCRTNKHKQHESLSKRHSKLTGPWLMIAMLSSPVANRELDTTKFEQVMQSCNNQLSLTHRHPRLHLRTKHTHQAIVIRVLTGASDGHGINQEILATAACTASVTRLTRRDRTGGTPERQRPQRRICQRKPQQGYV